MSVTRPAVTQPPDTQPWRTFAYTLTATTPPSPARIDTYSREPNDASGYRVVATFYDSLGRLLETKQQQYVVGVGTVVAKDAVIFDGAGHVAIRYVPFAPPTNNLTTYDPPPGTVLGTSFVYDALDRVTQTFNPDGTSRTADYSVAGQTTLLDENYIECTQHLTGKPASCPGAKTVERRDALGRVTGTDVYAGNTLVTDTANTYDGLGRMTRTTITDAATTKSAATTFVYDSFGRRTQMTDPDAPGVWKYAYDNAGNLVYQDDPKSGQHVEFCYDALNRVSRKLYPAGDAQSTQTTYQTLCNPLNVPAPPYIQYVYDAQSAYNCNSNAVGRLCAVREFQDNSPLPTVETRFVYDARGRIASRYHKRNIAVGSSTRSGSLRSNSGTMPPTAWRSWDIQPMG